MRKKAVVAKESPYANIRLPNGIRLEEATKRDLTAALDYYRTQIAQAQKEVRVIIEFMKKRGGKSTKN
jgi:hypothetical protein